MEPERGGGIAANTIQSRHDDGNPYSTLTNQVDINLELSPNPFPPGDGNAPTVVYDQAVTVPSAASYSPELPSSYGPNTANDPSIGVLPNPEDSGVQSVTPEPELTPDLAADASAWTTMTAPPCSESGYLIPDFMLTEDVGWRNPNRTSLSSSPTVHGDGYDPNRIPSSVFSKKPPSSEWSTASNESLFSIYMGNSFSGYQGIFMSGELSKIEGLNNSQNSFGAKANEGSDFSPKLSTLPETPPKLGTQRINSFEDDIRIQEGLKKISTAVKEESRENHGNKASLGEYMADLTISSYGEGLGPCEKTSSIPNRLSNDSDNSSGSKDRLSNGSSNKSHGSRDRLSNGSSGSFAFPVLVTDPGKSSSFGIGSDQKVQPPRKQQIEPYRTTASAEVPQATTQAAARERGCLSFLPLPAWRCCC